jgi:hypothetical protein
MELKKNTNRMIMGGIFFLANSLLMGCDNGDDGMQQRGASRQFDEPEVENVMNLKKVGVMTELQETAPNEYKIQREYPSNVTGVVIKRRDGSQEIVPEETVQSLVDNPQSDRMRGVSTALSAGLLGYMMGKTTGLNPRYYANDTLFNQSMANKTLIDERKREDERGPSFRSYWFGSGRYYSGRSQRPVGVGKATAGRTGFFSRFSSSFRGFSG